MEEQDQNKENQKEINLSKGEIIGDGEEILDEIPEGAEIIDETEVHEESKSDLPEFLNRLNPDIQFIRDKT
ncbi:MAG: hypothetical protein MRY83_24735, partial [Flavobacteriales bacterium]|nr:hypothetical protein [Flavobacteriales bacterium]